MGIGEAAAFFAGFFTFPVVVLVALILAISVAGYFESFLMALLFLVVAGGVMTYNGVGIVAFMVAHSFLLGGIAIAFLPIGYIWGIHFKLPRAARREAEAMKRKIDELRPRFIAETLSFLEAHNVPDWFVNVPLDFRPLSAQEKRRNYGENETREKVSDSVALELITALKQKEIPPLLSDSYKRYLSRWGVSKSGAWAYKDALFFWVVFWPWSMLGYIFTEMLYDFFCFLGRKLRETWNYVWSMLRGIVTRVIDKAFAEAGIDDVVTERKQR